MNAEESVRTTVTDMKAESGNLDTRGTRALREGAEQMKYKIARYDRRKQ